MDRHLGASFAEEAAQTRCVPRAPHSYEILSLRGRVNGTSTEEALQTAWPEPFIGSRSLDDTDDRTAAGSGISVSEDVGMDRHHRARVAGCPRGANGRSNKANGHSANGPNGTRWQAPPNPGAEAMLSVIFIRLCTVRWILGSDDAIDAVTRHREYSQGTSDD